MYGRLQFRPGIRERTVYGYCNALGQFVSICSHKRWDFSELVELQIFDTERSLRNVGVNDLEVELVCLCNGSNGCGAWVRLPKSM